MAVLCVVHSTLQAQCTLGCNQNLQISLDQSGQATITPALIAPYAAANCPSELELTVFNAQNQAISPTLGCNLVGQTLSARVRHIPTNNVCIGTVSVQDYLPPSIQCPLVMLACSEDTSVQAVGYPIISDNCSAIPNSALLWYDEYSDLPCFSTYNGQAVTAKIERFWYAADAYGNASTAVQVIYIRRNTLSDVVFPRSRDGLMAPFLTCDQNPLDLSLSGQPTVAGLTIPANGACELVVSHADQNLSLCGTGAKRILRTWTVSDYCASTFTAQLQVIELRDTVAPNLEIPSDFTVSNDANLCSATVTFPQAQTTDNCSSVSVGVLSGNKTGYGPHVLPIGDHFVRYTATDACGNRTTKTYQLTVEDRQAPSAFCKSSVQVALPANNGTNLPASSIDNGSTDNCGTATLLISRDGLNFSNQVHLDCSDAGKSIPVTLRATDGFGLTNTCISAVQVRETVRPSAICPAEKNLICGDNYSDLVLTGMALASDNCGVDSVWYSDNVQVNACGIGQIFRTWRVNDLSNNSNSCTQTINLNYSQNISVIFPSNLVLTTCTDSLALLPSVTGQPIIQGFSCSTPSATFTDVFIQPAPQGCFAIERRWKVQDHCVLNPTPGNGIWENTQRITVQDNTPPQLYMPTDLVVFADSCSAWVAIPSPTAQDCRLKEIRHFSTFAQNASGGNASGNYPLGTHLIYYTASDFCGNEKNASLQVTVYDTLAPSITCASGRSFALGSSGKKVFSAQDLLASAIDNCAASNPLLTFEFSPSEATCSNIGMMPISVEVSDPSGNKSSCQTLVSITDPGQVCRENVVLSGKITNDKGVAARNFPVKLLSDGHSVEENCNTVGAYTFEDVPAGVAYRIEPYNDYNPLLGVNTLDMLALTKHMLGSVKITSPYLLLAGDTNFSGDITPSDVVVIRKILLGYDANFSGGRSWTFMPKNHVFQDTLNPFINKPSGWLNVLPQDDLQNLDLYALKTGDLDRSASPLQARGPVDTVQLYAKDQFLQPGKPAYADVFFPSWEKVEAMQFAVSPKSGLRITSFELLDSALCGDDVRLLTGAKSQFRCVWMADPKCPSPQNTKAMVRLHFLPSTTGWLSDVLQLDTSAFEAEAYDMHQSETQVRQLALFFKKNTPEPPVIAETVDAKAYPNPFSTETQLQVTLRKPDEMRLMVSDAQGKVVFSRTQAGVSGKNRISLHRSMLPGLGVYFYEVASTSSAPQRGKVVLVEE